ncbi:MAG: hypothetical protein L0K67_02945 [Brevibacterium sp.]|nr:hypothetical protein [Brevibacterium sp.]
MNAVIAVLRDRILVLSREDPLKASVHDHTKRRADVGDRYRLTRNVFDVISAFGCLQAQGLSRPVIVGVLAEGVASSR